MVEKLILMKTIAGQSALLDLYAFLSIFTEYYHVLPGVNIPQIKRVLLGLVLVFSEFSQCKLVKINFMPPLRQSIPTTTIKSRKKSVYNCVNKIFWT